MLKWLASILGGIIGIRSVLTGVFMVILAIVFYNLLVEVLQEIMVFTITQISDVGPDSITNPSLPGFGGWFAAQIKLPECISVMSSCVAVRFVARKVPFLKW